ncbi:hypothetical protein [Saccharomonospora glauca]|uniref:hypothetical protein n=1 Tax=Saccharomonospora glauca TaxID=40990 RepID=UPI00024A4645|nr:hypothetical protein [Saccharomonospora glauca]
MTWQTDAELAGTLYKKAKPYTAMLIARCVEPGTGGPRLAQNEPVKTSEREFSELSGVSRNTVQKYLRTWDAMATAGLVPARDELEPGEDVELPDQKAWTYYYREANPPKPKKAKEGSTESALDVKGRVDLRNRRVQTALQLANGAKSKDYPGNVGAAITRLAEALQDIGFGSNPNRAFVAACAALADLESEF